MTSEAGTRRLGMEGRKLGRRSYRESVGSSGHPLASVADSVRTLQAETLEDPVARQRLVHVLVLCGAHLASVLSAFGAFPSAGTHLARGAGQGRQCQQQRAHQAPRAQQRPKGLHRASTCTYGRSQLSGGLSTSARRRALRRSRRVCQESWVQLGARGAARPRHDRCARACVFWDFAHTGIPTLRCSGYAANAGQAAMDGCVIGYWILDTGYYP